MEIPIAYEVTEQDIVEMEEAVGIYQHPVIPIRINGTVIESIAINETYQDTKGCVQCCLFFWMIVIFIVLLTSW